MSWRLDGLRRAMTGRAERARMREALAKADEAAARGERGWAMLELLAACGSPEADVAQRGGRLLADALFAVPPAGLVRMDERLRAHLRCVDARGLPGWMWRADAPSRVNAGGAGEIAALGVLAMHPDGRVRQGAVLRLAQVADGDGRELAFLLLRANDWVPEVRASAVQVLRWRMRPDYAPHWVAAIPLVDRLAETRARGEGLRDEGLAYLEGPGCATAVVAGLASEEPSVRRTCYALLVETANRQSVVRAGLAHADPLIRIQAARAADGLDEASLRVVLPRMLIDPTSAVRVAGTMLVARGGKEARWTLRAMALDRSRAVRLAAIAGLRRLRVNVERTYRAALRARAGDLVGVLGGLLDVRANVSAREVAPLLNDPRARVRAAAVAVYARRAQPGDAERALVWALGDASPRVSREARAALRDRGVAEGAVTPLLQSPHAHVRRNARHLLSRGPKWDAIGWVLRFVADEDPEVSAPARRALQEWMGRYNRSFTRPTPAQAARIDLALAAALSRWV